jgi:hypothetical protein
VALLLNAVHMASTQVHSQAGTTVGPTLVLCQLLKHGPTLAVLLAMLQGSCFFVAAAAKVCSSR